MRNPYPPLLNQLRIHAAAVRRAAHAGCGERKNSVVTQDRWCGRRQRIGARARLQQVCSKANLPYKGVHALRHYAGTRVMQQTKSLEDVARHLGHSSIEITRVYATWSDEKLRDVLNDW